MRPSSPGGVGKPDSAARAQPSMRQDKVMMGVIAEVMMASSRRNALLITFPAQLRQGQTGNSVPK
jgi:hypothetical protein